MAEQVEAENPDDDEEVAPDEDPEDQDDGIIVFDEVNECPFGEVGDEGHQGPEKPCMWHQFLAFKGEVRTRMDAMEQDYALKVEQLNNQFGGFAASVEQTLQQVAKDVEKVENRAALNPFERIIKSLDDIGTQIRKGTQGLTIPEAMQDMKDKHSYQTVVRASEAKPLRHQARFCDAEVTVKDGKGQEKLAPCSKEFAVEIGVNEEETKCPTHRPPDSDLVA